MVSALALGISFSLSAQMPAIRTEGKESNLVFLEKLSVNVSITGSVATTTWTMTFKNRSSRTLEGELNFPLPQSISVSRYALDINGRMREAVPVEKEKGTRIFENTERRRVDPGLLEKVDGNGFRTRIYPITAGGTRTVLIGYEQELSRDQRSNFLYRLPLAFHYPIEEFSVSINVTGSNTRPLFDENTSDALQFDEWKNTWSASRRWKDYKADQSIAIRIPKTDGEAEAMMQQTGNHYFYMVNAFPQQATIERKLPQHITLLWDASLSGLSRNLVKELSLLDGYLSRLERADVTLVNFSNTVEEPQVFTIRNGQWTALRTVLQRTVFDGATQFGALDLRKYPCDEYLLFSDGHSNFGSSDIRLSDHPVYTIVSAASSDFPFLQSIASRSGGECINLENTPVEQAKQQLLVQTLHFLGIRPSADLEESYPSIPTPVINGITIAGISYQPVRDLVLQFGYGGKVIREQTIHLNFARQQISQPEPPAAIASSSAPAAIASAPAGPDLSRIWAQKKIAELDTRYEDNEAEIEQLGRRYGIVTRNTSLIVLENINDYITYQVEPPAELREEYDRIMKARGQIDRQTRQTIVNNAETYFDELLNWWQTTPNQDKTTNHNKIKTPTVQFTEPVYRAPHVSKDTVRYPIRGEASTASLQEVVVTGYGTSRRTNVSRESRSSGNPVSSGYTTSSDNATASGLVAVPVPDNERRPGNERLLEKKIGSLNDTPPGDGTFTPWKADLHTDYLDKLKAAAPADQYIVYLRLRKEYSNTPLFYFNTAGFFLAAGKKALGLKILSNIAELDVENYELYKLLGYKLKELNETAAACSIFKKVLDWRPFEPQSYRDYGLALQDAGFYQRALDTLYLAMIKNYDANVAALYPGFEETLLPEINSLIALKKDKIDHSRIPKNILTNMPVDIRVVLNWNMNNTDIDLWVTDPDNEKCYYSHRNTAIGGRISQDFTRGLGPEQFLLKKAVKGKYKVEVNYYGDTQVKLAGTTTIMVEVYTSYGTPGQTRRIMTLQMLPGSNGAVFVGEFEFK
jgi:tetratricopeptide (TPR) repeat protein